MMCGEVVKVVKSMLSRTQKMLCFLVLQGIRIDRYSEWEDWSTCLILSDSNFWRIEDDNLLCRQPNPSSRPLAIAPYILTLFSTILASPAVL
jgi:hypothetical protein